MSEFAIQIDNVSDDSGSCPADSVRRLASLLDAALKPACAQCTRKWSKEHQLPAIVPVESALIMREPVGRGYLAVVYCHGKSAVLELGTETPSDNKIRSARAFA